MEEASLACIIAVCLLSLGGIHGQSTDDQECIVHEVKNLGFLYFGNILAYVTPEQPLKLFVTFKDHNMDLRRDTVVMRNDAATHIKVLEGIKQQPMTHLFPIKAPEGWVTLKLTAKETYVSLVWVAEREEKPLVSLTLDSAAEEFLLTGLFSTCSGDSPEWLVNENEEVDVKLDAENSEQKLEVMGDSSTAAYLKFSESKHDVHTNTTLGINTSRRGSEATVEVLFKDNKEEWNVTEKLQSPWPMLFMGGRRGSIRLRLKRSASSSSSPSPPSITSTFMVFIIVPPVVVALTGVIIYVACTMTKKTKKSHSTKGKQKGDKAGDKAKEDEAKEDKANRDKANKANRDKANKANRDKANKANRDKANKANGDKDMSPVKSGKPSAPSSGVEGSDQPQEGNDEDKTSAHRKGDTKNQGVAVDMPDEPEDVNDEDKTSAHRKGDTKNQGVAVEMPDEPGDVNDDVTPFLTRSEKGCEV